LKDASVSGTVATASLKSLAVEGRKLYSHLDNDKGFCLSFHKDVKLLEMHSTADSGLFHRLGNLARKHNAEVLINRSWPKTQPIVSGRNE